MDEFKSEESIFFKSELNASNRISALPAQKALDILYFMSQCM